MSSAYGGIKTDGKESSSVDVADFRSDTVTKPTSEMRQAMVDALVGDDVWGDDPTVTHLEEVVAKELGKDAGLYVPSGTMANLIAIMVHCQGRQSEMIVGNESHIHLYESGSSAGIAGVHTRTVEVEEDGTMDLKIVAKMIRPIDVHFPTTKLICIENTQNRRGGVVIGVDYMNNLAQLAHNHNLKFHVDGARIMNACVAMNIQPHVLVENADSVSVCLSKGLGAPVGSVLVGDKKFIDTARFYRKTLGGGMRQAGVIAAPALIAFQKGPKQLAQDHANAEYISKAINDAQLNITAKWGGSNIILISRKDLKPLTSLQIYLEEQCQIKVSAFEHMMRLVTHVNISTKQCENAAIQIVTWAKQNLAEL